MSFDFLTTKRILRKLGGDKIPGKQYTFDGNLEGKEYIELQPGIGVVKASNEPCDPNSIESISMTSRDETGNVRSGTANKDDLSFESVDEAGSVVIQYGEDQIALIINETFADTVPRGLWLVHQVFDFATRYTSKIQLADTIVPIRKDYLGGACLPVVELETVPTAEGTPLSESDIAKLGAANFALPCILKCSLPSFLIDAPVDFLAQGVSSMENNAYLAAGVIDLSVLGMFGVAITNQGDGWVAIDISVPNNSPDV